MQSNMIAALPIAGRQRDEALSASRNHPLCLPGRGARGWNTSGLDPGKYSRDNCFSLLIIEHAMTGEKAEDYET
jgi:hypothetical protein